jgi:hypothetical protein
MTPLSELLTTPLSSSWVEDSSLLCCPSVSLRYWMCPRAAPLENRTIKPLPRNRAPTKKPTKSLTNWRLSADSSSGTAERTSWSSRTVSIPPRVSRQKPMPIEMTPRLLGRKLPATVSIRVTTIATTAMAQKIEISSWLMRSSGR